MKKIYNLITVMLLSLVALASCEKENIFPVSDGDRAHGTLSLAPLKNGGVEISTKENIVKSGSDVDINAMIVEVSSDTKTYYNGPLSDIEILTLPVGEGYNVTVHSPENPSAAWDTPYYEGSTKFDITEGDVTYVETIVCYLKNVKVSVVFDAKLRAVMGDDCTVKVETGNGASLNFTTEETRDGFFRYEQVDGASTLVATFTGTVDENYEQNFRTYTAVAPGNHYIITYTLHGIDPDVPEQAGQVTPGLYVDATVTSDNLNVNVEDEDNVIPDTDRPQQGDDPNPPVVNPDRNAPTVTCSGDISGDEAWTKAHVVPAEGMTIKVSVASEHDAGLTAFTVDIVSDTLTEEVLEGVGLASHLDLVNPGRFEGGLRDLGFPVNVGGMKTPDVMDITEFTKLLGIYGAATHKFTITVTDANGTTVKTLTLISQ